MDINTINKRHERQSKLIKRRIKRRAKWISKLPKSRVAKYLRSLIVDDRDSTKNLVIISTNHVAET